VRAQPPKFIPAGDAQTSRLSDARGVARSMYWKPGIIAIACSALLVMALSGCEGCPRFTVTATSSPLVVGVRAPLPCGSAPFAGRPVAEFGEIDINHAFYTVRDRASLPQTAPCADTGAIVAWRATAPYAPYSYLTRAAFSTPLVPMSSVPGFRTQSAPQAPGPVASPRCQQPGGPEVWVPVFDFNAQLWEAPSAEGPAFSCGDVASLTLLPADRAVMTYSLEVATPLVPARPRSTPESAYPPQPATGPDAHPAPQVPVDCAMTVHPGELMLHGYAWVPAPGYSFPVSSPPDCHAVPMLLLNDDHSVIFMPVSGPSTVLDYVSKTMTSPPCG
jgi:hypothetical protein